jgi:hypothetical protein
MITFSQLLLVLRLVVLHGPTGQQEIDINPSEISSLREPREGSDGHFPRGTNCLITMTNGKINAVREDCATVRLMIEQAGGDPK